MMPQRYDASMRTPQDAYERERAANTHPAAWSNPKPAGPYHWVVIGAGPAGIEAAELAARYGARVALIERGFIGGECLNTGCVPSKTLIRTSRLYAEMRDANRYGARIPDDIRVDFAAVMERVRRIRAHVGREDSVRRLATAGIDVFFGEARFTASNALTVDGETLRFGKALIATGARPSIPPIPGLAESGYLTNESVFDLTELPRRLLVIGGGPLGCELAQAFCRLGAKTTIAQDMPLFLSGEDRDAAQILSDAFARNGIEVRLNTNVVAIRRVDGVAEVDLQNDDYRNTIAVDAILCEVGRLPAVAGLNLETAGVEYDAVGGLRVDDFLRTSNPDIYGAGDVCLPHQYTDTAVASARIAVQNALFGGRQRLSALVIPICTFTDPEIAHVGLYIREANRQNIPIKTFTVPIHEVDRAATDGVEAGFVKIHTRDRSDRILGATIVAPHAGEMINEITLAMVAGIGLRTVAQVVHAYPTQAEAIHKAAHAYMRTLVTPRVRERLGRLLTR